MLIDLQYFTIIIFQKVCVFFCGGFWELCTEIPQVFFCDFLSWKMPGSGLFLQQFFDFIGMHHHFWKKLVPKSCQIQIIHIHPLSSLCLLCFLRFCRDFTTFHSASSVEEVEPFSARWAPSLRHVEISSRPARTLLRVMSYHGLEITQIFNNKMYIECIYCNMVDFPMTKRDNSTISLPKFISYTVTSENDEFPNRFSLFPECHSSGKQFCSISTRRLISLGPATPESSHCQSASL